MNGITKKERKKMVIYVAMIVLGTIFATSLKDLWLTDLLNKYPPSTMMFVALGGMFGLYYLLNME